MGDKTSNEGDLADLCDWINKKVDPTTSFLTSMNLAGSMRLFTNVPMVVHPQFESENLRKRVQLGYELYHCGSEGSFDYSYLRTLDECPSRMPFLSDCLGVWLKAHLFRPRRLQNKLNTFN